MKYDLRKKEKLNWPANAAILISKKIKYVDQFVGQYDRQSSVFLKIIFVWTK